MFGSLPDVISWGDMDKRSVRINVVIIGDPLNSLSKDITSSMGDSDDFQYLVYSNSAMACEDSVIKRIESLLGSVPKEHLEGRVI